jgi:hypothetical protein
MLPNAAKMLVNFSLTMPRDITRLYRDIRVTGDIRERTPSRKTLIDSYSKLKTRTIKN